MTRELVETVNGFRRYRVLSGQTVIGWEHEPVDPEVETLQTNARVESTLYHYGNLMAGTGTASFRPRATTPLSFPLDLAAAGAIDMGVMVHHTLKASSVGVTLTATLLATIDLTEAGIANAKSGQTVWSATIPADARFWLVSERGTSQPGTTTAKVIEVPEFRMPVSKFLLNITPNTAPDEGDIYLRVVRRY